MQGCQIYYYYYYYYYYYCQAAYKFIEAVLTGHKYCRKIINRHFNKNLIMSEEEEIYFNKVTVAGFVKNLLIMMKKK